MNDCCTLNCLSQEEEEEKKKFGYIMQDDAISYTDNYSINVPEQITKDRSARPPNFPCNLCGKALEVQSVFTYSSNIL
jgi:hypothetical protein